MRASRCIVLSLLVVSVSALSVEEALQAEWQDFKIQNDKFYDDETEEAYRWGVYVENRNLVAEHNHRYAYGMETFKMKLNEFADLENEEFLDRYTGLSQQDHPEHSHYDHSLPMAADQVPVNKSVDWRKLGAVTKVKNQGQCGSCWAFSATGAIESHTFIKTNKLIELSEQDLIDCSKEYHNNGCSGGLMTNAFEYVRKNDGIDTELSYPYGAEDHEPCRYTIADKGATLTSHTRLMAGDERHMKAIVGTIGPVAVGVTVSKKFRFYHSGVFYDEHCPRKLNHGMLIVGYGDTLKNQSYWIVKNSWGPSWGEKGYIKMSRDRGNNCGISSMASFPIV